MEFSDYQLTSKDTKHLSEIKSDLISDCAGLVGVIEDLTIAEVTTLSSVDVRWCEKWDAAEHCGSFDNEAEAISRAFFSAYEQIIEDRD
jgi:hypothetical protein